LKSLIVSFVILSILSLRLLAQEPFEGTIEYDFSVSGAMAQMAKNQVPKRQVMKYGKNKMLMITEGGAMPMKSLVDVEKNVTYMINDKEKSAKRLKNNSEKTADQKASDDSKDEPIVTKLDEKAEILGYTCTKYKVVAKAMMGMEVTQYVWAAEKLKQPFDTKSKESLKSAGAIKGIEGIPLKMVSEMGGIDFKTTMTAVSVKKEKIPGSEFELPKDYKVEDSNLQEMMMKGGQ
jgi:hypothetical protein